jgi:hypothetical protein
MSCVHCKATVGRNYPFMRDIPCAFCGTLIFVEGIGTYLGKKNSMHQYRSHPKYTCPGCDRVLYIINFMCEEGFDVTAEFAKLSLSEEVKNERSIRSRQK